MSSYKYAPLYQATSSTVEFASNFSYGSNLNDRDGTGGNTDNLYLYNDFSQDLDNAKKQGNMTQPFTMRLFSFFIQMAMYLVCLMTFPVSPFFTFKIMQQYERIIVYRLGHLTPVKGPGLVFVLPCIDKWEKVDLRTKAFNVPPTNLCTVDRYIINLGATIRYRIKNPILMTLAVQDVNRCLRDLSQTCMTNLLCKRQASEIQSKRLQYSYDLQVDLNIAAKKWGLEISDVELSQVTVIAKQDVDGASSSGQASQFPGGSFGSTAAGPSNDLMASITQIAQQIMMQSQGNDSQASVSSGSSSKEALFARVKQCLSSKLVERVQAVYEFKITEAGDITEVYTLDLKNGDGCFEKRRAFDPDVVLTLSFETLQELLSKQVTAVSAYASGMLKIGGDSSQASKLSELINLL